MNKMLRVGYSSSCDPEAAAYMRELERLEEIRRRREERESQRRARQRRDMEAENRRQLLRQGFIADMTEFAIEYKSLITLDATCRDFSDDDSWKRILNGTVIVLPGLNGEVMRLIVKVVADRLVYDIYIMQEVTGPLFYALENLNYVRNVTFKQKVTLPEYSLLSECSVNKFVFESEAYIGDGVFSELSKLGSVVFNADVEISSNAFSDCDLLTIVDFEAGGKIGPGAFLGCDLLAEIYIKRGPVNIDEHTHRELVSNGTQFAVPSDTRAPLNIEPSVCLRL